MQSRRQAGPAPTRHRTAAFGRTRPSRWPVAHAATTQQQQQQQLGDAYRVLLPGLDDEIALTREPTGPGFIPEELQPSAPWVRPQERTITGPSVRSSGTLRPGPEWYPAWMRYRRREDNYTFWQDKFLRCSLEIPAAEKRWTVFSSLWWLVVEFKYFAIPASFRFLIFLAWRALMQRAYEAHKALVLWQSKIDAGLAARAVRRRAAPSGGAATPSSSSATPAGEATSSGPSAEASTSGSGDSAAQGSSPSSSSTSSGGGGGGQDAGGPGFSRAMALRRLHWKNSLLGELLYLINVAKTGRVHMLPPVKRPLQRPTFFFLF